MDVSYICIMVVMIHQLHVTDVQFLLADGSGTILLRISLCAGEFL